METVIRSLVGRQETGFTFLPKQKKNELRHSTLNSGHHVFEFPVTWSVAGDGMDNFGACRINEVDANNDFPSLKVLGTGDFATVNRAFVDRFKEMEADLRIKVGKVLEKEKVEREIIFTGHSTGGATAILATVWFLEKYRTSKITPLCITYGAPLVGDKVFGHALRRERLLHDTNKSWASCFINVVSIRDLVPRIHLSPLRDIQPVLQSVLQTWEKKGKEKISDIESCEDFFTRLVNNAFAVASYDSCVLRCSAGGSSLLEAVKDLVELSPYRPFGSFHFFVGEGKPLLRVDNHDAVLQILFYSLQLPGEGFVNDLRQFVQESVEEHLRYESIAKKFNGILPLNDLNQLPLSPQISVNAAFDALELGTEARLSLRAAGEMEAEKERNLKRVEGYRAKINECLKKFEEYRSACAQGTGYYDAFKLQKEERDFQANVDRLELIGYWEEVRELLKVFELPDSFETDRAWVELGTRIRFLVEPIDIANFYRHAKKDQTGLYETRSRARPNYYKYPENWLLHMRRFLPEDDPLRNNKQWNLDSCFWARVENMCIKNECEGKFPDTEASCFEKELFQWLETGALDETVIARSPTFNKWLGILPDDHRHKVDSRIRELRNRASPAPMELD
ncbi:unnamed protein product [Victoria cruziana]